jgi:hypothetical protein
VTDDFGIPHKSVTIKRNHRSRSAEMTGHDAPKWSVTLGRNTQPTITTLIGLGQALGVSAAELVREMEKEYLRRGKS